MFGGDWASDMVTNGARNDAIKANNRAIEWKATAEDMTDYAAENVVIRQALATQVAMVDPNHPLLVDTSLIERMKKAGVSALRTNNLHYEAVREVGRTFKIPGREKGPIVAPAAPAAPKAGLALRDDPAKLKFEYAGLVALRDALIRQLLIHDPTNPLLGDPMVQWRVRAAGQTAFIMNGEDFESAREAGKSFAIPGRE